MKINTDRLKSVSTKTDSDILFLTFNLIPEEKTQVCGHYFKIEVKQLPREVKRIEITIIGIDNTYFPKGWLNWRPLIKNGNGHKPVIGSNSVTVAVEVDESMTSCVVESYFQLEGNDITTQLKTFQSVCDYSLPLFNNPFSFIFGVKPTRLIVSRQHPGEGVASSFTEGIVKFLQTKKSKSEFIIVPVMGLRGLRNGEYRTNNGYDLNRSWMEDIEEILHVKSIVDHYGINEVLDIHGDEVSIIDYARIDGNPAFRLPYSINILAEPLWIRKMLSRLRNKIKTSSKGSSLRDYCKSQKIACTILELSMSKDNSFRLGFEFAETNLK